MTQGMLAQPQTQTGTVPVVTRRNNVDDGTVRMTVKYIVVALSVIVRIMVESDIVCSRHL